MITSLLPLGFYKNMAARPLYAPMIPLNDSLYLFYHLNDSCIVYNHQGEFVRTTPMSYHHKKGWKEEHVVDEEKQNIYTIYNHNGLTHLWQLSLNDCSIVSTIKLEEHSYPEKIKIKDGYCYYLHKERPDSYTRLYRQRME
jgi:hypothetical protein